MPGKVPEPGRAARETHTQEVGRLAPWPLDLACSNGPCPSSREGPARGARPARPPPPIVFEDISSRLVSNAPALHYGAAVVAPFGDGRRAFAVAGFLGPNRLLVQRGDRLVDAGSAAFQDPGRQAIGIAGGDSDDDGREEVYVVNTDRFSGPKRLGDRWFDLCDGHWRDLFELPQNQAAANLFAGRSVGAVDRRGDGRYAFVVANHGGPLRLYRSADDDEIMDLAPTLGVARVTQARSVLLGPFVSEHTDLFIGTDNGPNLLFRANDQGRYTEVAGRAGWADPRGACRGVALFDAGLGRPGIILAGWETPNRCLVPLLPGVQWGDRSPAALAGPGRVRSAVVGDFDNDGFEELFLNCLGEPNRLFRRTADQWREIAPGAALEPAMFGTGAVAADLDGDGTLELLVCHGEDGPQPLSLFRARRPEHGWLRIAPLTRAGAPARGATVQLFTQAGVQTRVLCGGSGYLCQQEPVAHFGLGTALEPHAVRVRWPDGSTAVLHAPEPRREHSVPHPAVDG